MIKELFKETYLSIIQHKMRSILTGFGITWGMFILIVLLGAGNGFRTGTLNAFAGYASNSMWITGYSVSDAIPGGIPSGTRIKFNDDIIEKLKKRFKEIQYISPEVPFENREIITYNDKYGRFEVKGIGEDYLKIKLLEIEDGRELNKKDYLDQRRSIIIGKRVKELLFEEKNPIGRFICISGVYFQVVGTLKEGTIYSMMEQNCIYMPDATLFTTYNINREYYSFGVLLTPSIQTDFFDDQLRTYLSQNIGFRKNDKSLYINNIQKQIEVFMRLFDGINVFLWVIGLCFLLSGIIGIANIMLVVVKERTTEIGIRKAIGATPGSIIQLIITESLIITIFFGCIGIFLGYIGMALYNWLISSFQDGQQTLFAQATIDVSVVLIAFTLLITSGVLAGIFPAQRAAKIMPIETLNKAT